MDGQYPSVNRDRKSSRSSSRSTPEVSDNGVVASHQRAGSLLQNPHLNRAKSSFRRCLNFEYQGVVLVLFWNFFIWTAGSLVDDFSITNINTRSLHEFQGNAVKVLYFVCWLLVWLIGTPLAGWLADSKFGRYKVIRAGFWLMLSGRIIQAVCETIAHSTHNASLKVFLDIVVVVSGVLYYSGGVSFLANAVQFGIDQMPAASVSQVTRFIYWFVFSLNAGNWVNQGLQTVLSTCLAPWRTELVIVRATLPVFMLSLALSSDFLFRSCLTIEPRCENPFKSIYKVLQFAAQNKTLRRRSAHTYWEEELPKRIDFGKMKYGGPFTTEEVEDVKVFLRILALMAPVCIFLISNFLSDISVSRSSSHYTHSDTLSKCDGAVISIFVYDRYLLRMVFIVVYDFLIRPTKLARILSRSFGSILRRLGIGAVLSVVLGAFLLIIDTVGHAVTREEVSCMFFDADKSAPTVAISYLAVDVSTNVIYALESLLYTTASLELICAQAPYSMRGLLIGVVWSTYAVSLGLSNAIYESWRAGWKWHIEGALTCGFVYYLFATAVGICGMVAYFFVARWYRPRIRQEPANQQSLIEEIYYRRCAQNTRRESFNA